MPGHSSPGVTGSPGRKYCSSSSSSSSSNNSNGDSASGDRGLQAARVRTASRWRCRTQQACFLQTRCYGHRGGWLSWEPEAGRDELGRAALPYDLGTQPGGEVGTGQKREKLGAGGV